MTSAFVEAWIETRVYPDFAVGASAVQFRDPDTESTATLLIVNAVGGWSQMQPSELPLGTLVAVKEMLVATPLVTDDGDLVIVHPPVAASARPELSNRSNSGVAATAGLRTRPHGTFIGASGDPVGRSPETVGERRDRAGEGSVGVRPEAIDEQLHE
jgi:hypothetical protein